jgi:hypothetical protein
MFYNSNYLRWGLYSVLAGHGGVKETVVFVAHEVLKGRSLVRQCVWIQHITEECLFGKSVETIESLYM